MGGLLKIKIWKEKKNYYLRPVLSAVVGFCLNVWPSVLFNFFYNLFFYC
mgnify:CR=1 FL=1